VTAEVVEAASVEAVIAAAVVAEEAVASEVSFLGSLPASRQLDKSTDQSIATRWPRRWR
jgi:hypothetical protein